MQNRRDNLRHWFASKTLPEKEKSYLSQLINGKASFGEKAARRIERDYGMPAGHLDTSPQFSEPDQTQKNFNKKYPRVVGTAKMGDHGYYLDLEGGDGYVEFEAEEGAIAIRVRGDSMFPAIRDGWYVVLEPTGKPTVNEYVLLKFKNGKKMVKELLQINEDCYVVMSVNGNGRITAMKDELDDIQAISAVVPPSKHKEW